jgi:hypothetical protein
VAAFSLFLFLPFKLLAQKINMQFQLPIKIKQLEPPISYRHKILLTGSCFTEHIGNYLIDHKFQALQNPNGILFDPLSVCRSLQSYIQHKQYTEKDLFELNEAHHSWDHHSRFSGMNKEEVLEKINASQTTAHTFLKEADWLIITLGSSFVYKLTDSVPAELKTNTVAEVSNCHKAPANYFNKHMLTIEETVTALDTTLHQLFHFNPKLKVIFTISPVRHVRDGVVENNRSKARLIEAVHHMVNKFDKLYYFPAYELVIDVLRDHRFYDVDLVHPNFAATNYVLEQFKEYYLDEEAKQLLEEIHTIVIARNHKPFNPTSNQHKQFQQKTLERVNDLKQRFPFLNLQEELRFFSK